MSDLIKREDAIDTLYLAIRAESKKDCYTSMLLAEEMGNNIPSAEPEQKKGKWIKVGHWGRSYKCNQCGNYLDFDGVNVGRGDANFCPNCGARMTR